ncbi:MAG: GNAT family N-acetyltransferase [Dysgonomonas mossii]|uniref:GNAT family N-acetyltransferase n=1 Tax=Dysgonomonas mossii TaxID=163665 RepID=UPI001D75F458|nr:GNAT family N-acetyltransferase [Dysgonomonas mossii]MBS5795752.1 GNAT family N-acetyltransferase [Dysgonomonas mossii]MBS7110632.1 GNAT family N-acetyltransferase [Dysgonomonas mossii]
MIQARIIKYGTADYHKMVALRYKILRAPLGLTFSAEYLEKEKEDMLYVCENEEQIVGCCILTPIDKKVVQLRQMAVDDSVQKKGIGSKLLLFTEESAKANGFDKIVLHARKVAIGFYLKYNYGIVGDEFEEVGIPHFEMQKIL